ncbi:MAG TPA: endonuclease/exonuclease/phosphatase family protein [Longimicrobium sp.]|nr:endonuclease/exonuclease/phosphatase family protein [Longimicrobium sp.]
MPKVVFWNTKGQSDTHILSALAETTDADIIVLAEMAPSPAGLLTALNSRKTLYNYAPGIGNKKIELYVRFAERLAAPIYETDRLTVRSINLPGSEGFLLAAVHFPSKYAWSEASQAMECMVLADDIRAAEKKAGHERTVLVGDLNMNPFENGVVSAGGLHAVMTRNLASRRSRVVQGREYPFFYNPMWGLMGDHSSGPPGTFFHSRSEQRVYFWNMFDQVLVRPALLDRFPAGELEVLTEIGGRTLLTSSGVPDATFGSDHLPIVFRIN